MQSYRLTINGDWFYLSPDYDIAGLKAALAEAVHSGGGFVDVVNSIRSEISLLVTAHSIVKFETIRTEDLPSVTDSAPLTGQSYMDDDYWLD